jgi:hypothetical protein
MLSSSAVLCLAMMVASVQPGRAQLEPLAQPEPEWLTQMLQEGWQKVAVGILQRSVEGSQIETFTYGAEGLQWMVQRLEQQILSLEEMYDANPSGELADLIDSLNDELADANSAVSTGPIGEPFGGEQLANCDLSFGAHAYADPLTGSGAPGVTARADAYFHNNCGLVGNTYAYAYVQGQTGSVFSTKTQEDPKYSGTWLDSAAQWSLGGSLNCYSRAYARAWSNSGFGYETEDNNYACPTPPSVSVSGPTNVYTDYYYTPCADVTWTASASGGTPGYTYDWYIGNVYQGSGSTLTKNYCYTNTQVTVKAIARDTQNMTAENSFTTYIYYEPEPYDPCMYGGCGGCYPNGYYQPYDYHYVCP